LINKIYIYIIDINMGQCCANNSDGDGTQMISNFSHFLEKESPDILAIDNKPIVRS
jgi:hypothetical protein